MNDSEETWKGISMIALKMSFEKTNIFTKVMRLFQNSDLQLLQFDIRKKKPVARIIGRKIIDMLREVLKICLDDSRENLFYKF